MYPTSADFFTQTKKAVQEVYLKGTIDDRIEFSKDHIIKDSYSISAQSTETTKVTIGTCYTKTLKLTLAHGVADSLRRTWKNKKITIQEGQVIDDLMEWVPMGTFYVATSVWTQRGINITAYDAMMNFDKEIDFTQTSGQAYDLLAAACEVCDVPFGMTRAQVEALPNGTDTLGISEDANILYYRDYIGYIAAALGGYAEIYRDGKLYIRNYHSTVDDQIEVNERFKNPSFSDFTSYFSEVTFIGTDGEEHIYQTGLSDGLRLELGANPLLQLGLDEVVEEERQRVANAVANINYTPFSITVLSSPYYDLGDVLQFPDGIADNCVGCCMSIVYKLGKIVLTGYGENPAQQKAKSATSKAISRASKTGDPIVYHTFINSELISLDTTWKKVAQLGFTVNTQTITEVWHEFVLNLGTATGVQVRYVYDGEIVPYSPETYFSEAGKHLLGTQMWTNATGQRTHRWEVYLKLTTGTATIAVGDVHILLKGQGLDGGAGLWDGTFELQDEFEAFEHQAILPELEETISLTTDHPELIVLSETFTAFEHSAVLPELTEEINLISFIPHSYLVTEDEDNITTEDGDHIIT